MCCKRRGGKTWHDQQESFSAGHPSNPLQALPPVPPCIATHTHTHMGCYHMGPHWSPRFWHPLQAEEDARRLLSLKAEALSSRRLARLLNSGPVPWHQGLDGRRRCGALSWMSGGEYQAVCFRGITLCVSQVWPGALKQKGFIHVMEASSRN